MLLDLSVIFFFSEIIGTISFSISGAILAIERELDLFGIIFLGIVTAVGGGIMRDILLCQVPPQAFVNYIYLLIAGVTAIVVFVFSYIEPKSEKSLKFIDDSFLNILDAIGLGIFSVIGVQRTISANLGQNAFLCIFLGFTTGVGGGMLRDLLSRSTPVVLREHIYALASLAGACCYYIFREFLPTTSVVLSMCLVVLIRVLDSHYQWTLPKIHLSSYKK